MPIPGSAFKAEMALWAEMAFLQTQGDEQEHQHAHEHVKAMKARQHIEGRAVNARAKLQVERRVSMVVLIALNDQEGSSQKHGQPHKADSFAAMAFDQRVVRDGQGDART